MKAKYKRRSPARILLTVLLTTALVAGAAWGGWVWYDNNVDRSGWVEEDGSVLYKDFHGKYVTGWQEIDSLPYYFSPEGFRVSGWQTIGADTYYFGDDGVMRTLWQKIDGQEHFFDADGKLHSGWLTWENDRYYLENGIPQSGWQELEGFRHYFDEDGRLLSGWQEIEGDTYYFSPDGIPLTGSAKLEGSCYYFGSDGKLHTGWLDTEDGRTYYRSDGTQAFGWEEIEGRRYRFAENGMMQTGWYQEGEYRYYLQEDGSAAVGPKEIDGDTYYFSPMGIHVVLVNSTHPVPDYYEVNLVTVTGWHQVSDVCLDALKQMLADCNAAGIQYNFNSAHRTIAEQTTILELRTQEYMDTGLEFGPARAKALQTVAIPGTSEHHLGLAVDLLGDNAVAWFNEHCWDYGFIVRYTAEKSHITGIANEPWHFRYVGKEVALDMKDSGLCLEEYLGAVS